MRLVLTLLVVTACGSATPPPPAAPAPVAPAPVAKPPPPAPTPEPASPPASEAAPPTPAPKPSLYERLHDRDGNVAGLPGFAIKRKPNPAHCGGTQIVTTRGKKVGKDDEMLAAVYKIEFPKGLFFDPDPKFKKKHDASLKKFNVFMNDVSRVGADARKFYEQKFVGEGQPAAKVGAAARLAQIYQRLASTIARAEIPLDVRTGDFVDEKIEAYCDKLQEVAEPIQDLADQAVAFCAQKAKLIDAGWWNDVCVAPAAP